MNIHRKQKRAFYLFAGSALIVVIALGLFAQSRLNIFPQLVSSTLSKSEPVSFPEIDTASLTPDQQKVVEILKQEYALQPAGTKYAEGIEEAWCADFVSWTFNEAGVPLSNPNSGHWRIPGTFTLREYYEANEKFIPADAEYSPKVGDIMLYDNPSSFGQHTNIVIKNDDGVVTTIGGNEPGGIRIVEHAHPEGVGFIGYGEF